QSHPLRSRTACGSGVQRGTHSLFQLPRATVAPCLVERIIAQCDARSCDRALIVGLFVKRYWNADLCAQARRGAPDGCCPLRSSLWDGQFGGTFQRPHRDNRVLQVTGNREALHKTRFGELQVSITAFGTALVSEHAAREKTVGDVARDCQRFFEIRRGFLSIALCMDDDGEMAEVHYEKVRIAPRPRGRDA